MNIKARLLLHKYRHHKVNANPLSTHEKLLDQELQEIQASLQIMNAAFKSNIKIQQIYLDLIKAKGKRISLKAKDIRNVYEVLSQNKTGEIVFMKQFNLNQQSKKQKQQLYSIFTQAIQQQQQYNPKQPPTTSPQQQLLNILILTYRRLYSRLIQSIIKKLTYYIINKSHLFKIILQTIIQLSKKLETLLRRLNDFKDPKFLFEIINIIYEENFILEKMIYEVLVNEGHVMSMEEFFRINGILMEKNAILHRNSRRSVLESGIDRCSVIGNEQFHESDDQLHQQARTNTHIPLQKYKYTKRISSEKNMPFIDRVHKDIQAKYASALDKLGDLVKENNQVNLQDSFANKGSEESDKVQQEESESNDSEEERDENGETPFERWKRENQKKKSTIKKRPSSFQYFSSEFKEIIKDLDQKKGKSTAVNSGQSLDPNSSKLAGTLEKSQFQKINKQTISLQNPLTVARLLQKKFNTMNSSSLSYMGKTGNMRPALNQKNQINKLLKIYENNQKENHVIDILFQSECLDEEHQKLQKGFMKLSVLTKLKEKRINALKQGKMTGDLYEEGLMRQVQEEYERLLGVKRGHMKKKNQVDDINDASDQEQLRKLEGNLIKGISGQKKRKKIKVKKNIHRDSYQSGQNSQAEYSEYDSQDQNELGIKIAQPNRQSVDNSKSKNQTHANKSSFITDPSCPNLLSATCSPHNKTPATCTPRSMFIGFEPSSLNYMNSIYNQFSNPLTKRSGYYGLQNYSSLRNSLEKHEISMIKEKKGLLKKSQVTIEENKAFCRKGQRQSQNKKMMVKKYGDSHPQNQSQKQNQIHLNNIISPRHDKQTEKASIFQHRLLQKYLQNAQQDYHTIEGEQIMRPRQCSESNSLSKTFKPAIPSIKTPKFHSKKQSLPSTLLHKSRPKMFQRESLVNILQTQKLCQPKAILSSDELDVFIQKYLQRNRKTLNYNKQAKNEKNEKKQQNTTQRANKKTQSMTVTQRNSWNKNKELYSTQRRVKVLG